MYSILIKDKKDPSLHRFLQVKKEVQKEVSKTITNEETGETTTETTLVGTGEFKYFRYEEKDESAFKVKFGALLSKYSASQLVPVNIKGYKVNLSFDDIEDIQDENHGTEQFLEKYTITDEEFQTLVDETNGTVAMDMNGSVTADSDGKVLAYANGEEV